MKKMVFLGWLFLLFAPTVCAQEKVEAPVWNVGDKWEFSDRGTIEVLKVEKDGYVVRFSESICIMESQGYQSIIFDKITFQRIYSSQEDKRKKYAMGLNRIFNFPYSLGKQWTDGYAARPIVGPMKGRIYLDYYEKYKILGWDNITIQGGKFKALKMEVIRGHQADPVRWVPPVESKHLYWYSPDVKYFVKCEYDTNSVKEYRGEIVNWELTSLRFKK